MAVRVFVGCAANNDDLESQAVFEWSLQKHASVPVDVTWMQLNWNPNSPFFGPSWNTTRWATPFSGFRWYVPHLMEYQGKAVYFDSDFIIRADIAQLFNQTLAYGRVMISKGHNRYCSILWDCAAAKQVLGEFNRRDPMAHRSAQEFFDKHPQLIQKFAGGDWNAMDITLPRDIDDPTIKAIHYTQVPTQLQFKYALKRLEAAGKQHWYKGKTQSHPRKDLQQMFDDYLLEASENDFAPARYQVPDFGPIKLMGS